MAFDPTSASPAEDADLLQRAACDPAGSAEAVAALYQRHGNAVYRLAWMLTGSPAQAADILHDTFIALVDKPVGYEAGRGTVAAYLCGIARHLACRSRGDRLDPVEDIDAIADAAAAAHGMLPSLPVDAAQRAQAIERLYEAIRRLPAHYRDVLVLVELQELSYAEVAAITGIEIGTVRSRLSRAKARLLELMRAAGAMQG
jgi:RNA polymerase sigma-70 factor (ECF subfamily)